MIGSLEGARILVVGAGTQPIARCRTRRSGNGRAIAVARPRREGAAVVCADRDERLGRGDRRLVRDEGGGAAVVVADVTDEEACAGMVAEAASGRHTAWCSTSASAGAAAWRARSPRTGTPRSR